MHTSRVEGDYFLWVGVGIRSCLLNRVAFLCVGLSVVLLRFVGCGSSGFGSSFFIVLVWFV